MPPSGEYLRALDSRLIRTWRIAFASAITSGRSLGTSTSIGDLGSSPAVVTARDERPQVSRAEIQPLVTPFHPLEVKEVIDELCKASTFVEHGFEVLLALSF